MVKKILIFLVVFTSLITAEELSSSKIDKCYSSSYELEYQQRFSEAIQALSPILKAYPNGYTINYRMGWLSYLNGNYANAQRYFKKALVIYPASLEVMNVICMVHAAQKSWSALEEQSKRMIKVDYFNIEGNKWYAFALRMQKKISQSKKVDQKMLLIYPTSTLFLTKLGICYFEEGDMKNAKITLGSVLTLDPYNQNAKMYMDIILNVSKEKE